MSHGPAPGGAPQMGYEEDLLATLNRIMSRINELIVKISMVALLGAALILSLSVVTRYLLKVSTDWQDETSVFLLVGAIFMCGAYVQSYRGHVGIEALAGILPPKINHVRKIFIDLFSFAFCAFFSWKSWAMLYEAWAGGHTTASTFAPPLWIPYGLLAAGMSNLTLQILLQIPTHFKKNRSAP